MLVCTIIKAIPAMSDWIEIVLSVSQRLWNQPLMSQPRRSASAPITTTISAHMTIRHHSGRPRFTGSPEPEGAAAPLSSTSPLAISPTLSHAARSATTSSAMPIVHALSTSTGTP